MEQVDVVVTPCGPRMSQVQKDEEWKPSVWSGRGGGRRHLSRIERISACWSFVCLREVGCPFKGKHVSNDCEAHPVVFEESVKLQVAWKTSEKEQTAAAGERAGATRCLRAAMMKMVDWRESPRPGVAVSAPSSIVVFLRQAVGPCPSE